MHFTWTTDLAALDNDGPTVRDDEPPTMPAHIPVVKTRRRRIASTARASSTSGEIIGTRTLRGYPVQPPPMSLVARLAASGSLPLQLPLPPPPLPPLPGTPWPLARTTEIVRVHPGQASCGLVMLVAALLIGTALG